MSSTAPDVHASEPDAAFFSAPIRLGKVTIPNRVWLAPLAGVSDVPFRRVCQELGAGLTYVEMLSATALNNRNPRSGRMLARHETEPMLGSQLTGPSADEVAIGIEALNKYPFETTDINMGCPVRKVVGKGWGSAILKEPDRVEETLIKARAATDRPITAKIRLGFHRKEVNVEEISRRVARAGAAMLMIHGRTREDGYSSPVNYEGIRSGFKAAREVNADLPLMGNGDIFDAPSARTMVMRTGCDAVLISRGALGNPWIFRQILGNHEEQPTLAEWYEVLQRHLQYHQEFYDDDPTLVIRFRKHLLWYVTGFPNTRHMRLALSTVKTLDELQFMLEAYLAKYPADLLRYDGAERIQPREQDDDALKSTLDRTHDRGVEVWGEENA